MTPPTHQATRPTTTDEGLIACDVLVDEASSTLAVLVYPDGDLYEATWTEDADAGEVKRLLEPVPNGAALVSLAPHDGELGTGWRMTMLALPR